MAKKQRRTARRPAAKPKTAAEPPSYDEMMIRGLNERVEHWRIKYDFANHELHKLKEQLAMNTPAKAQAVTISMNADKLLNVIESLSLALERITERD